MASQTPNPNKRQAVTVMIATTVMLTFISYWRAAAIVLSDLASSAYYVGGDAEKVIGKSAPWFILGVMVFSYAVRAVYVESSSMFVRGGVYRVVKEAMGAKLAKLSVSALMVDYVLTGPISAVAAGQYLAGFVQDLSARLGHPLVFPVDGFSAFFAVLVTFYFWRKNIQGIHESAEKAMRIMQITTVMVVSILLWCLITLTKIGLHWPPAPAPHNIRLDHQSLGWLYGTPLATLPWIAVLIGFGHSILAMSGEETLAQVNREIQYPKLQNLKKAGLVIFIYSFVFTGLVSLFAVMIIPDRVRPQYYGNLISGLAMNMAGPLDLRLAMQGFVVLVGVLILSGAVNTAIVGSNGVLNRVSEDGVMAEWFRRPQARYGTSYRIINLIVGLQLVVILLSRGNVYLLAALYAFGVIWSFAFNAFSVLVLRFKLPNAQEWKVPGNFRLRGRELPLGLSLITLLLFAVAMINFFTKPPATIAGLITTAIFFSIFTISEHISARQRAQRSLSAGGLDQFQLRSQPEPAPDTLHVRPHNILVTARDPNTLHHLRAVLERTDTKRQDVVVMTTHLYSGPAFTAHGSYEAQRMFDGYDRELFTRVVAVAEKAGKPVSLLVVPGTNVFDSIVVTAQRLESSTIIAGLSNKLSADEQGKYTGDAWERLPEPRPRLTLEVIGPDRAISIFHLGPHTPRLRTEDLELLHQLWLEITSDPQFRGLHHYDIVALALRRLQLEIGGAQGEAVKQALLERLQQSPGAEFKASMDHPQPQ